MEVYKSEQEVFEQVWQDYADSHWTPPTNPDGPLLADQLWGLKPMMHNRWTFISEIRSNPSFAKQWGVKIEEKGMSQSARFKWYGDKIGSHMHHDHIEQEMDENNVPTKLITITYKGKTDEFYE